MHIDARKLENHSLIEGDICIIGAGAAGISMAMDWVDTPYKVILLEGGGFEYDDKVQDLYNGRVTGHKYFPLKSTLLHYFGGTTGHWGGMCSVFDPLVFQKRDWVPYSGWPITQEDLIPYYKKAHSNLDLGQYEFDIKYYQKENPTLVPLPLDESVIWPKVWRFSGPTRFGQKYREDVVKAKNIHLYTYANVTNLQGNEDLSLITEATVKNYTGKQHKVRARIFVSACSATQNARLLLASNTQSAKGVGNDHDLVGRFFLEHIEVRSAELWLNEKSALTAYMTKPPKIRAELAPTAATQEKYKILNGIVALMPLYAYKNSPDFGKVWADDDPRKDMQVMMDTYEKAKGNKLKRAFESENHQAFQMIMRLEQAPNPDSRVTLDPEKDELGMPRVHLNWAHGKFERDSARKIYEIIGEQVGLASIGRVKIIDDLDKEGDSVPSTASPGWHHMGTTRMSDDPKSGVVDANCRVHGIGNLYMAGASCYTNGAAVNPTLTVVAISLRLSDYLKKQIRLKPF